MTAKCWPPALRKQGTWHIVRDRDGDLGVAQWGAQFGKAGWLTVGRTGAVSAAEASLLGWTYECELDLAALVAAEKDKVKTWINTQKQPITRS